MSKAKKRKYVWIIRYFSNGLRFSEWMKTEKDMREACRFLDADCVNYKVTKYELTEVRE